VYQKSVTKEKTGKKLIEEIINEINLESGLITEFNQTRQTSNPTTFSTNNILGGFDRNGKSSRIWRKENARASPVSF